MCVPKEKRVGFCNNATRRAAVKRRGSRAGNRGKVLSDEKRLPSCEEKLSLVKRATSEAQKEQRYF